MCLCDPPYEHVFADRRFGGEHLLDHSAQRLGMGRLVKPLSVQLAREGPKVRLPKYRFRGLLDFFQL